MTFFRIREIGQLSDAQGAFTGVVLEGDREAVRALSRFFGLTVTVAPALPAAASLHDPAGPPQPGPPWADPDHCSIGAYDE